MGQTLPLELATVGDGALAEAFHLVVERMVANILDPNTSATAERGCDIKLRVKPGKGRTAGALKITVVEKLAGAEPYETTVFMGRENGHPVMMEHNPDQIPLPLAPVSIDTARRASGDE